MAFPLPPPYFTAPKEADKIVQTIRTDFVTQFATWLQHCFPIAKIGVREDGETYPQIYANDGSKNHYSIVPDDTVNSFIFFEDNGNYNYNPEEEVTTYNLSLVFWGRLDLIDVGRAYDFTSELIAAIKGRLKVLDCINISVNTNYKEVFRNYSMLKMEKEQFLLKQMTGFRITFDYIDTAMCTQPFTVIGGTGCAGQQLTPCDLLLASLTDSQLLDCILPSYNFANTDVQNALTAQQITDLTTFLCGGNYMAKNISTGALTQGAPKSIAHGIPGGYTKYGYIITDGTVVQEAFILGVSVLKPTPGSETTHFTIQADAQDYPAGFTITVIPAT